jgi:hypothetical protein
MSLDYDSTDGKAWAKSLMPCVFRMFRHRRYMCTAPSRAFAAPDRPWGEPTNRALAHMINNSCGSSQPQNGTSQNMGSHKVGPRSPSGRADVQQPKQPKNRTRRLCFWSTNIRGLQGNFEALRAEISTSAPKPDMIFICETWIHSSFADDNAFQLPGYDCYRRDRTNNRTGGGVAVYCATDLPTKVLLKAKNYEGLWLNLRLNKHEFLFALCYNPPPSTSGKNVGIAKNIFDGIEEDLHRLYLKHPTANFVLLGDLNMHNPGFLRDSLPVNVAGRNGELFCLAHGLHQLVDEPTYFFENRDGVVKASTLDVMFTNSPADLQFEGCHTPIGRADHLLLKFSTTDAPVSQAPSVPPRLIFSYRKTDWLGLQAHYSSQPWDQIVNNKSIDHAWFAVHRALLGGILKYSPHRTVRPRYQKPWFDPALLPLLQAKKAAHAVLQYERTPQANRNYKKARNLYASALRKCKKASALESAAGIDGSSPKNFWRLVNSQLCRGRKDVTTPFLINNVLTTDSAQIASELNQTFADKCRLDERNQVPPRLNPCLLRLSNVQFKRSTVYRLLLGLDASTSTGPDGIPAVVLKNCAAQLAAPLAQLFHRSFRAGVVPAGWKLADVYPIHKKDSKHLACNYRPISLLPIVAKVMEDVVKHKVSMYLETNGLLHPAQFGFRKGHSTLDALLSILQPAEDALSSTGQYKVVSLDISSAFDRVWHVGLLAKLRAYGIQGSLYKWICSYLSGRFQRVVYKGTSSPWLPITAGVPQGSILGPTLFLLYINDLPAVISNKITMFADDTTIHCSVKDFADEDAAIRSLNNDLKAVGSWASSWLISFNMGKSQALTITRRAPRTGPDIHHLQFSNYEIQEGSNMKLLGVEINSTLDWSSHVKAIAGRASQCYGALRRCQQFLSEDARSKVFKSVIRPLLEYCSPAWSGAPAYALSALDKVQRNCHNMFPRYWIDPLQHRRDVADLSVFYKYHSMDPSCRPFLLPPPLLRARATRQAESMHSKAVTIPRPGSRGRDSCFVPRVSRAWNALPETVFSDVRINEQFRRQVHRHLNTGHPGLL